MRKKNLLIAILLLVATPRAFSQSEIDPVSVSPHMYTVLLENEHVRVVRY